MFVWELYGNVMGASDTYGAIIIIPPVHDVYHSLKIVYLLLVLLMLWALRAPRSTIPQRRAYRGCSSSHFAYPYPPLKLIVIDCKLIIFLFPLHLLDISWCCSDLYSSPTPFLTQNLCCAVIAPQFVSICIPLTSINNNIRGRCFAIHFYIRFAMKIQQHYQNSTIPHRRRDGHSEGRLWMLDFWLRSTAGALPSGAVVRIGLGSDFRGGVGRSNETWPACMLWGR